MKYHLPSTVVSPISHVSNVRVIFDGQDGDFPFSVVKLDWNREPRFALRWNISETEWHDPDKKSGKSVCNGMPVSRAKPVWFVLPDAMFEKNSEPWIEIERFLAKESKEIIQLA